MRSHSATNALRPTVSISDSGPPLHGAKPQPRMAPTSASSGVGQHVFLEAARRLQRLDVEEALLQLVDDGCSARVRHQLGKPGHRRFLPSAG